MTGAGIRGAWRALVPLATVAVVADLAVVHAAFIGHYPLVAGDAGRLTWDVTYVVLLVLGASAAGVTEPPRRLSGAAWSALGAVAGAAGAVSMAQLALGSAVLPRFVVFGSAVALVPAYTALGRLGDRLRRDHQGLDRVVAVVSPAEAAALQTDLGRCAEQPATLVGVVPVAAARPGRHAQPLVDLAAERGATVVVLDRVAQADEAVVAQAAVLHRRGLRVRTLTLFYDEWLGKLPLGELEQVSLMFDIQELHGRQYARMKRLVDVAVAAAGCAVLAVVAPLVLVADLAGNRGPLLFRQRRVGRGGREFTMVKFRTMPASSADGPWTAEDDPRLGRVGRAMRRTHLDELPQLVNVLRGELSLVGPRPEQPCYVDELRRKIPFYDVRHLVHPGLTGWAQVKFPYGASVADALEKLQYEFWYLRHQGMRLDARIVARTLRSVVGARGR